jgi:type III pantothenate kinase
MRATRKTDAAGFRLAVDIGNTHTVIGLFRDGSIRHRWRLATRPDTTVDEIAFWLRGLQSGGKPVTRVSAAALASVVPSQDEHWLAALREAFGVRPKVLDYRNCGGLRLDYEIPGQIGADRLANVLGARALGVEAGVILDFGTATTFDVFAGRAYLGGVICPGIQSGMRALAQNTAKLHEAELRWPARVVGRNTDDALRIGILRGTVGMVESLLRDILRETRFGGRHPEVLATGGLAFWIRGRLRSVRRFEPDLTLIGIHHLLSGPAPRRRRREKA